MKDAGEAQEGAAATDGSARTKPGGRSASSCGGDGRDENRSSTPPDAIPVPAADADGNFDLSEPACFLNRELTWLNFNFRVLREAEDEGTPLLERVKFISIVSSNLDEFFMKRIGGLKQQVGAGVQALTVDGRTPQQQIVECHALVRQLEERKNQAFLAVKEELEKGGVLLAKYPALKPAERDYLREYYLENIYPLVTPQATDPAHPFPFISNLSVNLLVTLRYSGDPTTSLSRVKVPVGSGIPRLLRVKDTNTFVPLENVMAHNLDLLFPGMEIDACSVFRVTRNSNTERAEDKAEDLLELIETELRERRFAPVVRLEISKRLSSFYRGMLAAELGLDEQADVFEVKGMLGLGDLMELTKLPDASLHDPVHRPVEHPELTTDRSIFDIIRDAGSILLLHPYQSYSTSVERFLREASEDPQVRAIKMCLYRTSAESKAIPYLIEAARNGKQVAVVVELKARFDEAANIRWASRLEEVGVHVTYGVLGLKTHCKVILVVRHDHSGLRRYIHVGTGNYHAGTARLYSDVGLLTSDVAIGQDLTELLNYLTTGYRPKRTYKKILPSPKVCKQALLEKIRREIAGQSAELSGLIQIKTNALEDADITRALYEASQRGVKVDLIVRDTCRLRPGVPGLSENVRVISIVGRFLEHSRVYYFRNGGDEEYYVGSADAMKRNLESRVEILVPVEPPALRKELRYFLDQQLEDPVDAWELQPDGSYLQRRPIDGQEAKGSQEALIEHAEDLLREVTRLKRRAMRGIHRRNPMSRPAVESSSEDDD